MKKNKYIQTFTTVCLIAIFALSNTPIKVLHHLFANHVDQQVTINYETNQPQLHVAGIDCHVESNVVINPYIFNKSIKITGINILYAEYTILEKDEFHFTRILHVESRGPPLYS
ncbi:MAG: hypothetical protein ABIN48_02300 [Ginsengibacter sp.]